MSRTRHKPKLSVERPESGVPIEQCLLVQDEIWRIISEAARTGTRLSLNKQSEKIASGYSAAGFSPENIADALVFAAVDCGVAFEVPLPAPRPALDMPALFGLVSRKRKQQTDGKVRPTFAGVPIPAAS
jgi:hypothetical protein